MGVFSDVTLVWGDKEYKVAPNRVFRLIAAIEEHISITELCKPATMKRTSLASAYTAALHYAGCTNVTEEQVYDSLFSDTSLQRLGACMDALVMVMVPPERLTKILPKGVAKDKKKLTKA